VLLAALLVVYVFWTVRSARHEDPEVVAELEESIDPEALLQTPLIVSLGLIVGGLVGLVLGARWLVNSASTIAADLGASELVIGLTVVSFGTSMPELAASVVAVRRGQRDIAVGNVVGSNMFNLLGVLGLPGVIAPGATVDHALVTRDFPIMFGVTVLLIVTAAANKRSHISRKTGFVLVCLFVVYFVMLFAQPS
jgi:cation:H+ antiporter